MRPSKSLVVLIAVALASCTVVGYVIARSAPGIITIRIVDQDNRPLKGAWVQAWAITPATLPTPLIEVLPGAESNEHGEVKLEVKGAFEGVVKAWAERIGSGRPWSLETAVIVSITYETDRGLYTAEATVAYSPIALLRGRDYGSIVVMDLRGPPDIGADEIRAHEEEIREKFSTLGEGLRVVKEWHVDFQFVYPETGYAEIPVMWVDAREHDQIDDSFSWDYISTENLALAFRIGFAVQKGKWELGEILYKIGSVTLKTYKTSFGDTKALEPGKFSYIYIMGSIAYVEKRLYDCVYYYGQPIQHRYKAYDRWKIEAYFRDIKVNSDGKLDGGIRTSDEPPDILTELFTDAEEAGFYYELYGDYTGTGSVDPAYKVEYSDISTWSSEIEFAIPIGAILAKLIEEAGCSTAAPLGKIAALSVTPYREGAEAILAVARFDAPGGTLIRLYVLKTDFKYKYKGEEHEIAIMGLKFYKPESSGSGGGGGGGGGGGPSDGDHHMS